MMKNDRDGCIISINQESKLQLYKIRRTLHNIIRARLRDEIVTGCLDNKDNFNAQLELEDNQKPLVLNEDFKHLEGSVIQNEETELGTDPGLFTKNCALLRYKDGRSKIVSDGELAAQLSQNIGNARIYLQAAMKKGTKMSE
jgi:hypothetical protein